MSIRIIILSCFLFVFANNIALGQQMLNAENLRNVQVERLTNEEIKDYYDRAKMMGLSDSDLLRLAGERGLPEAEIAKLKERIEKLNVAAQPLVITPKSLPTDSTLRISTDAAQLEMTKIKRDSLLFGAEFFTEVSRVFVPNYKIATPSSYVLGPGDEINIQVYGYSEKNYKVVVTPEGSVYIPNVGPVQVSGLSFDAAADKIRNKLGSTIYTAIRGGATKVEVTLDRIKSIQVTVVGQASKPGTYTIPSLATAYNLLQICGGPSDQGSFRQIELIRGNKLFKKIDLYDFLVNGDRSSNILLQDQDVIKVPYAMNRVQLIGEAKRAAKFEMLAGETFDDLLRFAGGFNDQAFKSSIKLTRITDTGKFIINFDPSQFNRFTTQSGDVYKISEAINRYNNRITIKGAVYRPDDYEYTKDMQLKAALEAAGVKPDAFLARGLITRLRPDQSFESISFSPGNVLSGKQQVILKAEDIVVLSSIYDLKDAYFVQVNGEVRNPSKYNYRENLTLNDLILMAGGFTELADKASIEISRRITDTNIQDGYKQAEIIRVDLKSDIEINAQEILLKPFDLVNIHPRGSFESTRQVSIGGQIMNPGSYTLQNSKERISSILQRAGGFKPSADSTTISIRRFINQGVVADERQRTIERLLAINRDSMLADPKLRETYFRSFEILSVNIEKIKKNPGGAEDIVMEDGDYLEAARSNSLVRVSGEVFRIGLLPYEGKTNALDYIRQSGNFTPNARRKGTFVIYPDGRAKSTKSFLFFRSYPDVISRSEIFVPSKDKEHRKGMSTGEWIAVSSIMATLATMAVTILNALK